MPTFKGVRIGSDSVEAALKAALKDDTRLSDGDVNKILHTVYRDGIVSEKERQDLITILNKSSTLSANAKNLIRKFIYNQAPYFVSMPLSCDVLRVRNDSRGFGGFKAPRRGYLHKGVDYECKVGDAVLSPINGTVSKANITGAFDHAVGFGTAKHRYISIVGKIYRRRNIQGKTKWHLTPTVVQILYVTPSSNIKEGTIVKVGEKIGVVDDILREPSYRKGYVAEGQKKPAEFHVGQHIHVQTWVDGQHVDANTLFHGKDDGTESKVTDDVARQYGCKL